MRRFGLSTARILIFVLIGIAPFLALGAFVGWSDMQKVTVFAFFVGMYATVLNGRRVGVGLASIFAVFMAVATQVHASPVGGAVVVALAGVMIAVLATRGLAQAMLLAAMFIPNAIATPPQPWEGTSLNSVAYVAAVLAATFAAGLWGCFMGGPIFDRLPDRARPAGTGRQDALIAAALLVPATALIAFYSMTYIPETKWVWILATIYGLMQQSTDLNWAITRDMVVGTVLGVCASVAVLTIGLPAGWMLLVGALVMCGALSLRFMGKPYWMYSGVVTAAAILMTGAGMDPFEALEDRLFFTILGAIATVALGAGITWVVNLAHVRRDARARPIEVQAPTSPASPAEMRNSSS